MKVYNNSCGFVIKKSERINEIDATLVEMKHEKSGASLFFLDREDDNKTFAIGFKTIPTDDTGVFHIIEHSVLCGSQKFPLKDPFTELIKGSISTYLNAITFGDKTVYPVSSKNDKAFLGLIDVYLDAVLHPNALKNPYIFMQEGWRYEINDGQLEINGVVYNEMKGAYSSADEYADYLISRLSSPNGTYSYDSGGNPDNIPELTFDRFKETHAKFYHPSNSYIFLDGSVKLDEVLPLINGYLEEYESIDFSPDIDLGNAPITEPVISSYPIEKEDSPTDKTRIYLCTNSFTHAQRTKNVALALITESIADSNNAPLTKNILKSGLCESFNFYPTATYAQNVLNTLFIGVKDGCEQKLIELYNNELSDIVSHGIPKENLKSALGRLEFTTREADYGSHPKGMVYMGACLEYAMHSEDPAIPLQYDSLFKFLREKIDTDYYDEILREVLDSPVSTLILKPDPDFNDKKENELIEKLEEKFNLMSDKEKDELCKINEEFAKWQATSDTSEAIASIPKLTIEDLKTEPEKIPTDILISNGISVITHPLHTAGIVYPELFFDVSDIAIDDIPYLRIFTDMISEWDTELGDASYFRNRMKRPLGSLYMAPVPIKHGNDVKLYIMSRLSYLESEEDNALALLKEQLYATKFNNAELLEQNIKQIYTSSVEMILHRGDSIAMMRNAAKHSEYDALVENLYGYTYHSFIKNLCDKIKEGANEVLEKLEKIRDKYLTRSRLTVGITTPTPEKFIDNILLSIKDGGTNASKSTITTLPKINDGIAIPSTVSYCSRGGNLHSVGENLYTGAFSILTNILTYEILWNEIRVKGGAYDTGFVARSNSGTVGFYSFRDPSPTRSGEVFANSHKLLSEFLHTKPDLLKYIIGCIGAADTVSTPRNDGAQATKLYLSGKTHEDILKTRRESVNTTIDDLKKLNAILESVLEDSTMTVVAPRNELATNNSIEVILDI